MTDTATVKTVEHGDASALPETGWFWRRCYVFIFTLAMVTFAWCLAEKVNDIGTIRMALRYAFGMLALLSLLYLAGASTEAITRLLAAVRTTRRETISSGPPPATVTEGRVETPAEPDELPADRQVKL